MALTVTPHPKRAAFLRRTLALDCAFDRPSTWELFRFINPRYSSAADIVSGEGARHAAGRWNPPQSPFRLSYTALTPETALAETFVQPRYYRQPVGTALPRVLVNLRLEATRVLDLREGAVRKRLGLSLQTIRQTDWRRDNQGRQEAVTQAWGAAFEAAGFEAVIVPSGTEQGGDNVLVFPANFQPGSRCEVVNEVQWT